MGRYLPILPSVRRNQGTLMPIESAILESAIELRKGGQPEFHGFLMAKQIADRDEARRLTAHGTLYKALDRLERAEMLASRWEDPELAAAEGRPRRRLYQVTGLGERVAGQARPAIRTHRSRPWLEPA